MGNRTCHVELTTGDVAAAKKFYKSLFDWKLRDMPEMGYTLIDMGQADSGGGIQAPMAPQQPTGWMPYIEVASVKRAIAKAEKSGGQVRHPFTPLGPGMGAIGVIADPQGNALGLWEKPSGPPPARPAAKKGAAKKGGAKKGAARKAPAKKAAKRTAKTRGR